MNPTNRLHRRTYRAFSSLLLIAVALVLSACGRGAPEPEAGLRTITIATSLESITTNDPEFQIEGLPLSGASISIVRPVRADD